MVTRHSRVLVGYSSIVKKCAPRASLNYHCRPATSAGAHNGLIPPPAPSDHISATPQGTSAATPDRRDGCERQIRRAHALFGLLIIPPGCSRLMTPAMGSTIVDQPAACGLPSKARRRGRSPTPSLRAGSPRRPVTLTTTSRPFTWFHRTTAAGSEPIALASPGCGWHFRGRRRLTRRG